MSGLYGRSRGRTRPRRWLPGSGRRRLLQLLHAARRDVLRGRHVHHPGRQRRDHRRCAPRTGRGLRVGHDVGYAILQLAVGRRDAIVAADGTRGKLFDAPALGITQLEFTVETPPSTGLVPAIASEGPDTHPIGFALTSGGQEVSIRSTSTSRVSISDYTDPDHTLDPSRILSFGFTIGQTEQYDFCIRNLRFLDANGLEVLPPL